MRRRISLWPLVLIPLLLACRRSSPPYVPAVTLPVVRIAGATSMYPLARALIAAYAEHGPREGYPPVEFRLETAQLRNGVAAVQAGEVEIGLVARDLSTEEKQGLSVTPVAMDGIVVVVNPQNPAGKLSLDDLRRLYTGEISGWADVGGHAGEVQVITREASADTRRVFEEKVMHGTSVTRQAIILPNSEAVFRYVRDHTDAIGYLALSWLQPGVKGMTLEGIMPDADSIGAGAYPLSRPLCFVTTLEPSEAVQAFLCFALSPMGQQVVARYHAPVR